MANGLLDFFNSPTTALAAGLLAPSPQGTFGGGLLQGLGAMNTQQQAIQRTSLAKAREQMAQQQILAAQQQQDDRKERDRVFSQFRGTPGVPGQGPVQPGQSPLKVGGTGALGATSPGGEQITGEELQGLATSLLSNPATAQQGISLLQSFPKPRASKLLTEAELQQQMQLKTAGRPLTFVGGEPATVNELLKFVDSEGNTPGPEHVGKSPQALADAGFAPVSEGSRKARKQIGQVETTLNTLSRLAEPVFLSKPGVVNRLWDDAIKTWDRVSQDDKDLALFEAFSNGTVASLVRGVGEKGNLSEGDVNRGLALIPNAGKGALELPDTREVAQGKLKQLRSWFDDQLSEGKTSSTPARPAADMTTEELLKGF